MSGYLLNLAETANLLYLKCIAGAFGAAFSNIVTVVYYMICSTACQAIFMYFPGIYRVTVHVITLHQGIHSGSGSDPGAGRWGLQLRGLLPL